MVYYVEGNGMKTSALILMKQQCGIILSGLSVQDKLPLFLPYARLPTRFFVAGKKTRIAESSNGNVIFYQGGLTQTHRNLLDVLFTHPEDLGYRCFDVEGQQVVTFEFSHKTFLDCLGKTWSLTRTLDRFYEMIQTLFSIQPLGETRIRILDEVHSGNGRIKIKFNSFYLKGLVISCNSLKQRATKSSRCSTH